MKVLVKFVGRPYRMFGASDVWLLFHKDKVTLREVIAKLEMDKEVKLDLKNLDIVVFVNGRHMEHLGGLDAELQDSDKIVIASFVAGAS